MEEVSDWEETIVLVIKEEPKLDNITNFHSCKTCSYKTKLSFLIKDHVNQHAHAHSRGLFDCRRSTLEQYKCESCDFRTYKMIDFNKHMEGFHVEKTDDFEVSYMCNGGCGFQTHSKLVLFKHARVRCKIPLKFKYTVWFNCKQCSHRFRSVILLKHHLIAKHTVPLDVTWYECDTCPYKAKQKYALQIHQLKHEEPDDVEWFQCDQCPYKSNNKFNWKYHIRMQHVAPENFKWFKCTQCTYQTKRRGHYNRHMISKHTKESIDIKTVEKWHYCDHCPYQSAQKSNVKRHILTHKLPDDNWFHCEQCSYKTKDKYILKLHVRRNHELIENDRPFECDQCAYKAKRMYHLKEHLKSKHLGLKREGHCKVFECAKCTFRSTWKRALRLHVMKQHRR